MNLSNKTIWMIWYQGLDSAPPLVRLCIDSWCRSNPDWKVIVLDRKSLRDWINSKEVSNDRSDLTVQKISNLARLLFAPPVRRCVG